MYEAQMPEAVLLDMDGTLVDSEPHWFAAEAELAARYGFQWLPEHGYDLVGGPMERTCQALREIAGVPLNNKEIIHELISTMERLSCENAINWVAGAKDFIFRMRAQNIVLVLVTTSPKALAAPVLQALAPGTFAGMITGDDVRAVKPDPEPYRRGADLAAQTLGLTNRAPRCVAVEDSASGIAAALAAGVPVINVEGISPVEAIPNVPKVASIAHITDELLAKMAYQNPAI